jgi:hypothetical protein
MNLNQPCWSDAVICCAGRVLVRDGDEAVVLSNGRDLSHPAVTLSGLLRGQTAGGGRCRAVVLSDRGH